LCPPFVFVGSRRRLESMDRDKVLQADPEQGGCNAYAPTPRIHEVIALCLAEQKAPRMKFIALEQVEVAV
jgi:hypothetical protein